MSRSYRYEEAKSLLRNIVNDLGMLTGESVSLEDLAWQDIAGTLSCNLKCLAARIDQARAGNVSDGPVVFPSLFSVLKDE